MNKYLLLGLLSIIYARENGVESRVYATHITDITNQQDLKPRQNILQADTDSKPNDDIQYISFKVLQASILPISQQLFTNVKYRA